MARIAVFVAIELHDIERLLRGTAWHGEAEKLAHLFLVQSFAGLRYGLIGIVHRVPT